MLNIDGEGLIIDSRIKNVISPTIERGPMPTVCGIIVHQTDSSTAQATLNSYKTPKANGAHFLIDKDGTIYQTASVFQTTNHVGKLKARCLAEMKCTPTEIKLSKQFDVKGTHDRERKKSVPDRYPSNEDSLGIEIVGKAYPPTGGSPKKPIYEPVNAAQNQSLRWLIQEIRLTLKIPLTEVFRHPTISYKNETEAESAAW